MNVLTGFRPGRILETNQSPVKGVNIFRENEIEMMREASVRKV